jgi:hypothetical protein
VESLADSAGARQHHLQSISGGSFKAPVHDLEHHAAHLSSAFHVSPFEKAVILSIDGFGDFASAVWGVGAGATIRVDGHVYFPCSLSVFYQAITQFLGFPHCGDDYKVMGLAPYGRPTLMRQLVSSASPWHLCAQSALLPPSTRPYCFAPEQHMDTPISIAHPGLGNLANPLSDRCFRPARTAAQVAWQAGTAGQALRIDTGNAPRTK